MTKDHEGQISPDDSNEEELSERQKMEQGLERQVIERTTERKIKGDEVGETLESFYRNRGVIGNRPDVPPSPVNPDADSESGGEDDDKPEE